MSGDVPIEVFTRGSDVRKNVIQDFIDLLLLEFGRAVSIWFDVKVIIVSESRQIASAKEIETFDFFQAFLCWFVDEVEQGLPTNEDRAIFANFHLVFLV